MASTLGPVMSPRLLSSFVVASMNGLLQSKPQINQKAIVTPIKTRLLLCQQAHLSRLFSPVTYKIQFWVTLLMLVSRRKLACQLQLNFCMPETKVCCILPSSYNGQQLKETAKSMLFCQVSETSLTNKLQEENTMPDTETFI